MNVEQASPAQIPLADPPASEKVAERTAASEADDEPKDIEPKSESENTRKRKQRSKKVQHKFPVAPTVISVIQKPRDVMNHSYRDFSKVPAEIGEEIPTKIEDMSFSQKVHHILSQDEYKTTISWLPHGRAFKVHVPVMFERNICEKYFGHKRYSSFLRQLNNFGFKHLTKGADRNSYYHECMLEGRPHLCKYMPPARDARRLIPDPDNEPDFYRINALYPLQESAQQAPAPVVAPANLGFNLAPPVALGSVAPAHTLAAFQQQLPSALTPQLASALEQQLPPAKIARPAMDSLVGLNTSVSPAALQQTLDVAQARRELALRAVLDMRQSVGLPQGLSSQLPSTSALQAVTNSQQALAEFLRINSLR